MMSKVTSTPLSESCSYRSILNMESIPSLPKEIEELDKILKKSEKLTAEIDTMISASIPTKDCSDHHRVVMTGFWIITSILSHAIYNSIKDLHLVFNTLDLTVQSSLELDVIALNIVMHDVYDLSRLYIGLFRVLQTKCDKSHLNQQSRILDLITSKSDSIQHSSCVYLDRLTTALGRDAEDSKLTAGVHHTLKSVGYFSRIVNQLRNVILTPPMRKLKAFTETDTGKSMLAWLGTTLKLVVKNFAPPMLSLALEEISTSLHPIEMLNRKKPSDAISKRPISSSELTLRRNVGRDDIPKI